MLFPRHLSRLGRFLAAALLLSGPSGVSASTLGIDDGVNVMASYFGSDRGNIPIGWDLMRRFENIGTVRIEVEPDEGVAISTVQGWIRAANACGYKVIVTHHCYRDNGSDDPEAVQRAARWWKTNYAALSEAGPFTINLINEWGGHDLTAQTFADTYNKALAVLREFYTGPVIVDIPGWAQETVTAAEASPLIRDNNIVYSVHIYSSAFVEHGPRRWMQPQDLVDLAKVGRPVMIGEFGGLREGGADWRALVAQAKALGWTVLAWSWNGDGEGMNMVWPDWNQNSSPQAYYPSPYFTYAYGFLGDNPAPQLSLSVRGGGITLGHKAQVYVFIVRSSDAWNVSVQDGTGWVSWISPLTGWGDKQVTLGLAENTGATGRTAVVTVRCSGIVRKFTVHQDSAKEEEEKYGK